MSIACFQPTNRGDFALRISEMGILGIIELIMLAWGGYALVTGTLILFKVEIEGLHARLAGLVLMLPVPLSLAVFAYQVSQLLPDAPNDVKEKLLTGVGILECCILGEEASHQLAAGRGHEIRINPEGSMVCTPSGGGNTTAPGQPTIPGYSTYIFSTRSFKQPLFYIEQGAFPQAVAFDPATQRIYANSGDDQLAVYDAREQKLAVHKILNGGEVWRYLVHPSGRKVVVFMSNKVVLVEVPQ